MKKKYLKDIVEIFLVMCWPVLAMMIGLMFGETSMYYCSPLLILGFVCGLINADTKKRTTENKEHILCAANFYDDYNTYDHKPINITTGFITCGQRHHNCISTFAQIVGFPYSKESQKLHNTEVQGFLTSENRFVGRAEAAVIALEAGQIKEPIKSLHSEDLY